LACLCYSDPCTKTAKFPYEQQSYKTSNLKYTWATDL